jgi:putative flippase GtrA
MKELFGYIKNKDFKALFAEPTTNLFIQMFRYLFVGGGAFIVDWGSLALFKFIGFNLYVSTALAFVLGLVANYILSKAFVFKAEKSSVGNTAEFIIYGVIGVIGLGLTELLMFILSEKIGIHFLISKIIAAAIVLVWNFVARKLILYRGDSN